MKMPAFNWWLLAGICVVACLSLPACNKKVDKTDSVEKVDQIERVDRPDAIDWYKKMALESYQQYGRNDPKWDEAAKAALTEYAKVGAHKVASDENWAEVISNNCAVAVAEGCDDSLIRYLYCRNSLAWTLNRKELTDAYCKAAQQMQNSGYPAIFKYYAWLRTVQQINFTYGYGTNIPSQFQQLHSWQNLSANCREALSDKTLPPETFYEVSYEFLELNKGDAKRYADVLNKMREQFPPDWKNQPSLLLLMGQASIDRAWQARGGGYANTVTKDGWKQFADQLGESEDFLTSAWKLDSKDERIATAMLRVLLGEGKDRDTMELWFKRAMDLNPKNYAACSIKLSYIEPKWYGSVEAMLSFSRECVTNKQWGGHIPLITIDAHMEIRDKFVGETIKTTYWKRPEVWHDLKPAFERFFDLNPQEIGWYHNYAWYAYQAGDWATLNEVIPRLGPINYDFFGGETAFNKMIADAKEHAGKS